MGLPKGRVNAPLSEHFNLNLSAEQLIWVRQHAEANGIPQAQVIRNGIRLMQDKYP